jgi:hypothetical protein
MGAGAGGIWPGIGAGPAAGSCPVAGAVAVPLPAAGSGTTWRYTLPVPHVRRGDIGQNVHMDNNV